MIDHQGASNRHYIASLNFSWAMNNNQGASLASKVYVTLVLLIRNPTTNGVEVLSYANSTKTMDARCVVFVNNNVENNTVNNGEAWCHNLVKQIRELFPLMNLLYDSNVESFGSKRNKILGKQFLKEDIKIRLCYPTRRLSETNRSSLTQISLEGILGILKIPYSFSRVCFVSSLLIIRRENSEVMLRHMIMFARL